LRRKVKITTKLWHPHVTSNLFFERLACIRDSYNFIESEKSKFIIYQSRNCPVGHRGKVKIQFGVENMKPNMQECDWAFGFPLEEEVSNKRYLRLPNYVRLGAGDDLVKVNLDVRSIISKKKKFCAFICFNGNVRFRNRFFRRLSQYKRIDAPGKVFNNIPFIDGGFNNVEALERCLVNDFYGKFDRKVKFLRDYKFVIAFENEESVGYTSERLYHAFSARCIPIYWGNSQVDKDFNTKSFLNFYDYGSVDALIDAVIEIDKDEDKWEEMLKQPYYHNNKPNKYVDKRRILQRFGEIFKH